jgi:hypothetical protein
LCKLSLLLEPSFDTLLSKSHWCFFFPLCLRRLPSFLPPFPWFVFVLLPPLRYDAIRAEQKAAKKRSRLAKKEHAAAGAGPDAAAGKALPSSSALLAPLPQPPRLVLEPALSAFPSALAANPLATAKAAKKRAPRALLAPVPAKGSLDAALVEAYVSRPDFSATCDQIFDTLAGTTPAPTPPSSTPWSSTPSRPGTPAQLQGGSATSPLGRSKKSRKARAAAAAAAAAVAASPAQEASLPPKLLLPMLSLACGHPPAATQTPANPEAALHRF